MYVNCMSTVGGVSTVCRRRVNCMPVASQLHAGGVSTACRRRVNCMPAACQLHAGGVSAACRRRINCMPTACQLYVGCMSVAGVSEGWRKKGLSDGGLSSRTRFACPRGLLLGLEARERYVGSSAWRRQRLPVSLKAGGRDCRTAAYHLVLASPVSEGYY